MDARASLHRECCGQQHLLPFAAGASKGDGCLLGGWNLEFGVGVRGLGFRGFGFKGLGTLVFGNEVSELRGFRVWSSRLRLSGACAL